MRALVVLVVLFACAPPPRHPRPPHSHSHPHRNPPAARPHLTWTRVASPDDVPRTPPPAGTWRVHLIDVGTGLAILIQGHDFAMLFDGGSNDRTEKPLRVLDYLGAALGPSGDDDLCVDPGAPIPKVRRRLDHLVLSHPHMDHASALDLVLHCYDVAQVWDSGRVNDTVFYRDFLTAVARDAGATYHTAAVVPDDRTVTVKGDPVRIPDDVTWQSFSEGDVVPLGKDARFTILHAEAKAHGDINDNSIVIAIELGRTRVLLTGDAGSGRRADPDAPTGAIEAHLLDAFPKEIDADILQVGHHGSKTSSRRAFLDAVSPRLALVSAGPKAYGPVVLPDASVIAALHDEGAVVLRTDEHDDDCPDAARLGAATGPGGCDSYVITIGP